MSTAAVPGLSFSRPRVAIVTPALADANNGNWQTASRWARLLRPHATVALLKSWPSDIDGSRAHTLADTPANTPADTPVDRAVDRAASTAAHRPAESPAFDVLLALHAGRSAASIAAWHQRHGHRGLAVVLTGTDLYRDLHSPQADVRQPVIDSMQAAARLVVLQDHAMLDLPAQLRDKAMVIFQSTGSRQALPKTSRHLRVVMVGHLRPEKDPLTLMRAARLIGPDEGILIDHIGGALDGSLEQEARQTQAAAPHYRWLGALPHEAVRRRIQQAHLLVHSSRMEGGAHVIMEAVCSGTPVLASRMAGNLGMLGQHYGGYFEVGDVQGLVQSLRRLRADHAALQQLSAECARRAPLFSPEHEAQSLIRLLHSLYPSAAA